MVEKGEHNRARKMDRDKGQRQKERKRGRERGVETEIKFIVGYWFYFDSVSIFISSFAFIDAKYALVGVSSRSIHILMALFFIIFYFFFVWVSSLDEQNRCERCNDMNF